MTLTRAERSRYRELIRELSRRADTSVPCINPKARDAGWIVAFCNCHVCRRGAALVELGDLADRMDNLPRGWVQPPANMKATEHA
jgi:hypothetical protein